MAAVAGAPGVTTTGAHAPRVLGLALGGLLLIAVASVGLLQVMQTTYAAGTGYAVRALEQERMALAAEVRLLEAEVALMTPLSEIRTIATERLGMVPPRETITIAVSVASPAVAPLPERYVAQSQHRLVSTAWWERLLGALPGFE